MGLSASQARFLQLTARKSDVEYQAQQVTQERLSLAQQLTEAANDYNDAISNTKLVFSYTDSSTHEVDVTYANYKNYMNQQLSGLTSSQKQMFLVSTSGKIVVANEEDMMTIIENNTEYVKKSDIEAAQAAVADEDTEATAEQEELAQIDWTDYAFVTKTEDGEEVTYYIKSQKFTEDDFVIVEDLDNVDLFQNAIKEGIYSFATFGDDEDTEDTLVAQSWSTIGNGAISEKNDETDDAQAEAEYDSISSKLELYDKKLQMTLDELETQRDAIKTEMDSVQEVMNNNIEKTFNTFG